MDCFDWFLYLYIFVFYCCFFPRVVGGRHIILSSNFRNFFMAIGWYFLGDFPFSVRFDRQLQLR